MPLPRWRRRPTTPRQGQATLEMAIVLPVLAVLTMGVLEMGMLLNAYITIVNLAREGARIAVDGATNCEIRSVLHTKATQRITTWTTNGAVVIVRGDTRRADSSDTVGVVNTWSVDPNNPTGWTPLTPSSSITGLMLDNSAGYQFVLVEVQYNHPTITNLPFANNILVSSRSIIRTAASNTHAC
jgi:Flp pilus assembly protein TadG